MGRIWESINASNQHMLTHVPSGQIASSPLCKTIAYPAVGTAENSMSILLVGGNIARKMFLVACWHWVYVSPSLYIFKH